VEQQKVVAIKRLKSLTRNKVESPTDTTAETAEATAECL
jgi:hypothetical protein